MGALTRTANAAADLTEETSIFMRDNREPLTATISDLEAVMASMTSATARLDSTLAAVNAIIASAEVRDTIDNVNHITGEMRTGIDSLNVAETAAELRALIDNANKLVINYDYIATQAREDILGSLRSLEETLENLREATDVIRENPSVLIRGRRTTGDRIE